MWIFTKYGFFSIASASKQGGRGEIDPDQMMIRARSSEHLHALKERFGLEESILESMQTDYRYRLIAQKATVARVVSQLVLEQDWSNFKNEAAAEEKRQGWNHRYVSALHKIWAVMADLQWFDTDKKEAKERNDGEKAKYPRPAFGPRTPGR